MTVVPVVHQGTSGVYPCSSLVSCRPPGYIGGVPLQFPSVLSSTRVHRGCTRAVPKCPVVHQGTSGVYPCSSLVSCRPPGYIGGVPVQFPSVLSSTRVHRGCTRAVP